MKVPPTPAPEESLEIASFVGAEARQWILETQKQAAAVGYTVLAVQLQAQRTDPTRLMAIIGPSTPYSGNPAELLRSAGRSVRIPGGRCEVWVTSQLHNLKPDQWETQNTIVAPRGYVAFALNAGFDRYMNTTGDLVHASFSGNDASVKRKAPHLTSGRDKSLLDVLEDFCRKAGHRLEYLATDFGANACAVIEPSKDALLDVICYSSFRNWYLGNRKVTATGQWALTIHFGPMLREPSHLFYPQVLVPPTGYTQQAMAAASLNPRQDEGLENGVQHTLDAFLRGGSPAVDAVYAKALALRYLSGKHHEVPHLTRWFENLVSCGPAGRTLGRIISHQETTFGDRRDAYEEMLATALPGMQRLTDPDHRLLRKALDHPPEAPKPNPRATSRLGIPSSDFRL